MAYTDNLGRQINGSDSSNADQLKRLLRDALMSNVSDSKPFFPKQDKSDKYKKLEEILSKIDSVFAEAQSAFSGLVKKIDNFDKMLRSNKEPKVEGNRKVVRPIQDNKVTEKTNKSILSSTMDMLKKSKESGNYLKKIAIEGLKKGSIYTHDIYVGAGLDNLGRKIDNTNTILSQGLGSGPVGVGEMGTGSVGGGTPPPIEPPSRRASFGSFDENSKRLRQSAANTFGAIGAALTSGYNPWQDLFAGAISDELEFMSNIRAIAYETEGITGDAIELQKEWENINRQGDIAAKTGVALSKWQNHYIRNLKFGIRNLEEANKVTNAGLNLGTMLGVEAGMTSDLFVSWATNLKLSGNQLAGVSREVQKVARNTGVTGENLVDIVRGSEKLLKSLKDSANYSAETAGNIMTIRAEASKRGVTEATDNILEGLSSAVGFFDKIDDKTRSFLSIAAGNMNRVGDLFNGTALQSRGAIKDITSGIESILTTYEVDINNLGEMSAEQLALVNRQLYSAFGLQVGEIERIIETLNESAKSPIERIEEINKKIQDTDISVERRQALEAKVNQISMDVGFSYLTAFDQASEKAKTIEDAMSQIRVSDDLLSDLNNLGVNLNDATLSGAEKIKKVLGLTADKLKEAGGKDFTDRINKAIASNDLTKVQNVMEEMTAEQQKIGIEQKKGADPLSKMAQRMLEMNESIRGYTGPAIKNLVGILGTTGLMLVQLTSIAASLGLMAYGNWNIFKGGGKFLGKFFSKIAGGARGVGGALMNAGGLKGVFGNLGKGAARGIGVVSNFTGELISSVPILGRLSPMFASLGGTLTSLAPAAGGVAATLGSFLGPLAAILGIWGGVTQALEAGEKAAYLFGVAQDKVTISQKLAAESAGFWTGILNTLTFGIFSNLIGPTGTWTAALAKLMHAFPLLTYATQALLLPFKIITGIFKGIYRFFKNVFIGVWEAIKEVVKPIGEAINEIYAAFKDLFSPLSSYGSALSGTGSVVEDIAWALGSLGEVLGGFIKYLGIFIGLFIRNVLKPVVNGIKIAVKIFKPFVQLAADFLGGIGDIIEGVLNFDSKKIASGLMTVLISTPYKYLQEMISVAGSNISNAFKSILNFLKTVGSVLYHVAITPFKLIYGLLKTILGSITNLLINVFKKVTNLLSFIFKTIISAIEWALQPIIHLAKIIVKSFKPVVQVILDLFGGVKDVLFGLLDLDFERMGSGLITILQSPLRFIWEALSHIPKLIIKIMQETFKNASSWISTPFENAWKFLKELGSKLYDVMVAPFKWAYDLFVSMFENMESAIRAAIPDWLEEWIIGKQTPKPLNNEEVIKQATEYQKGAIRTESAFAEQNKAIKEGNIDAFNANLNKVLQSSMQLDTTDKDLVIRGLLENKKILEQQLGGKSIGFRETDLSGIAKLAKEVIIDKRATDIQGISRLTKEEALNKARKDVTADPSRWINTYMPQLLNTVPNIADYFPSRKEGGPSIGEGLHYLHDDEYVLSKKDTVALGSMLADVERPSTSGNMGDLVSVEQRIQRDRTSEGNGDKELSQIALYSGEQVNVLYAILDAINNSNKSAPSKEETNRSKNSRSKTKKADFGKWQLSGYSSNASRQVINNGV